MEADATQQAGHVRVIIRYFEVRLGFADLYGIMFNFFFVLWVSTMRGCSVIHKASWLGRTFCKGGVTNEGMFPR